MATADQLLEKIFSWIKQKECCAEQLRKLARELESLREKCNAGECVGNSVSVLGAACLIGAGAATLFTGGAAAPILGVLGATYSGIGVTVSLTSKITEHFISSDTMKEAQNIEKKSNEIGETIQRLFEKLKEEKKEVSSSTDPDELDQHVMTEIVGAMARRSGLRLLINISAFGNGWGRAGGFDPTYRSLSPNDTSLVMTAVTSVLICFSFRAQGKASKLLFAKGAEQLLKKVSSTGFKSFLKGGGLVVGGAVGMVFALSEAIDNWKEMIKKNHVTEASQSLRDTADTILEMTRTLREQLDNIKRILEEMEKHQREQEENSAKKQEEEKLSEENAKKQEQMEKLFRENTSQQQEKENDQNEQAGGGGGGRGGGRGGGGGGGGDPGDEESDSEEEESDSEEDTEEDESEQTGRKKKKKLVVLIKTRKIDRSNQGPPGSIRVGLLNVRSLNNKTEEIRELIIRNNLDIFHLIETWLQMKGGDKVLKGLLEEFSFVHKVRPTRKTFNVKQERKTRGGGVATLYAPLLQGKKIKQTRKPPETFEHVAAELQHDEWGKPVLSINVYRPPGNLNNLTQFRQFLEDFQSLLDAVSEDYNSILITGDFNIHVDDETMRTTTEFLQLLERNNLVQHVEVPTHHNGHTLDLVITRNVEISDITVQDDRISDHYTVSFNARPVSNESDTEDPKEETKEKTDEEENTKRYKRKEE